MDIQIEPDPVACPMAEIPLCTPKRLPCEYIYLATGRPFRKDRLCQCDVALQDQGTAYYDVSTHRCYTISQTVVSGYSSFEGGKCIYNHVYGFHVGDTENRDEFEDAKEVCEAVENSGVFSSFHCTITEPTIYMTQYTWRVEGTGYTDNCYVDAREKDYVPDPIEHVTVTINTRCSGETYGGAAYSITLEKGESLGNRYPGQPCEKEGSVFQGWIDEDGNYLIVMLRYLQNG